MKPKLPPFGKALAERQRFANPPFLVVVCVGLDAWARAKSWSCSPNDCVGLVLQAGVDPGAFEWPVKDCQCVIETGPGPGIDLIDALARQLFIDGAASVTAQHGGNLEFNRVRRFRRAG